MQDFNAHKKVVNLHDNDGVSSVILKQQFDADHLSGIIEFWTAQEDCTLTNYFYLYNNGEGNIVCVFGIINDAFRRRDVVGWADIGGAPVPVDSTWYHISIRYRATGGDALASPDDDLLEGDFRIYIDGTEYGDWDLVNDEEVRNIWCVTSPAALGENYYDAVDYSWASGWTLGRNYPLTNTNITSSIDEFITDHKIKDFPRARAKIFSQTLEYDDIILLTGNYNSYHNSKTKQVGEIYKGTEGFRSTAFESLPTGWTDSSGGTSSAKMIDKFNEHAYIIQLYDNDANQAQCWDAFSSAQSSGTIEAWLSTIDCTLETGIIIADTTPTDRIQIMIDADKFQYYNSHKTGGAGWEDFSGSFTVADCAWYRIRLTFDGDWYFGLPDNFNLETVGTTGTSIAWVDSATLPNSCTCTIDTEFDDHKNILKLTHDGDVDDPQVEHDFPGGVEVSGTREFWWGTDDNSNDIGIAFYSGATQAVFLMIRGSTNDHFWFRSAAGWTDTGVVATNNTLFHHKIVWDAVPDTFNWTITNAAGATLYAGVGLGFRNVTDNCDSVLFYCQTNAAYSSYLDAWGDPANADYDLGTNLIGGYYDIYVYDNDNTLLASDTDVGYSNDGNDPERLYFETQAADADYLSFLGAVGYSWGTNDGDGTTYIIGDNANLETTLTAQTIFEGRVIKQNEEYIQDIELEALSVEVEELMPGEEGTPYTPDGYAHIANYSEEVIAETINDKCNNITATLTDEIYRGTYTFENDSDNAIPMGWIDASTGSTFLTKTDAAVGNHLNLIELADTDANSSIGYLYFEAQESGTIEFWIYTTDATLNSFLYLMNESAAIATAFRIDADNFYYYEKPNGAAAWLDMGTGPTDATWYRIRFDFECGAGAYLGLAADTANIYIYNTAGTEVDKAEGYTFGNVSTTLNYLLVNTQDADNGYTTYIDAIGFSWDKHYIIGDNAHIYIEKVKVGAQTIDYSSDADHQTLQGEVSLKRIFNGIVDLETYIWTVTPDHKFILSDGTEDSQIDFAALECWGETGTDIIERYNTVITKGGFSGGSRVYGSANDADAQATYGVKLVVRYYTSISDTELDTIAANILTMEGNTPKFVELNYRNTDVGYLQPGETVTIPASTFIYDKNNTYIDAGEWIVSEIRYDALRDVSRLTLVNALFFEYDWYLTQELESLINQ